MYRAFLLKGLFRPLSFGDTNVSPIDKMINNSYLSSQRMVKSKVELVSLMVVHWMHGLEVRTGGGFECDFVVYRGLVGGISEIYLNSWKQKQGKKVVAVEIKILTKGNSKKRVL